MNSTVAVIETQDLPSRSRPAFVSLQQGGRQQFPSDRVADAVRERDCRARGLVRTRRITAAEFAASLAAVREAQ